MNYFPNGRWWIQGKVEMFVPVDAEIDEHGLREVVIDALDQVLVAGVLVSQSPSARSKSLVFLMIVKAVSIN